MKKLMMLSTLMLIFVVASCNKDQRAVKRLEGEWKLVKENGQQVDADVNDKISFTKCKLKNDEYCTLTFTSVEGGQTYSSTAEYLVKEDGTKLEIKTVFGGSTYIDVVTIRELDKDKLVIEIQDGTSVYTEEYEKQ